MGYSILIADDYAVARYGLRNLLEQHPAWKVVGEAVDGREAVNKAYLLRPNLVILDEVMPRLSGLAAAVQIRRVSPQIRLMILGMYDDGALANEVAEKSIDGYALQSDSEKDLLIAVRKVLRGEMFSGFAPFGRGQREHTGPRRLTERERQVLQLIAEGKSTKDTASLLGISVKTAESHRMRLMQKLDIHETASLVRYAVRRGLVQP